MGRCQKCGVIGVKHGVDSPYCEIRQQRGREIAQELRAMEVRTQVPYHRKDGRYEDCQVLPFVYAKHIDALIEKLEGDT